MSAADERNVLTMAESKNLLDTIKKLHFVGIGGSGDAHLKNFGEKRAVGISPVRTALALGVHCNFHQDSPVLPPDMLETLRGKYR